MDQESWTRERVCLMHSDSTVTTANPRRVGRLLAGICLRNGAEHKHGAGVAGERPRSDPDPGRRRLSLRTVHDSAHGGRHLCTGSFMPCPVHYRCCSPAASFLVQDAAALAGDVFLGNLVGSLFVVAVIFGYGGDVFGRAVPGRGGGLCDQEAGLARVCHDVPARHRLQLARVFGVLPGDGRGETWRARSSASGGRRFAFVSLGFDHVGNVLGGGLFCGMYYWYMYAPDTADLMRQRGEADRTNGYSVDVEQPT
ncbi:hypothetical protein MAJ_05360, partial [Metarhizium majus ARSEF 297]